MRYSNPHALWTLSDLQALIFEDLKGGSQGHVQTLHYDNILHMDGRDGLQVHLPVRILTGFLFYLLCHQVRTHDHKTNEPKLDYPTICHQRVPVPTCRFHHQISSMVP